MKKHNINELENMIINILAEGKEKVWNCMEQIKNPLERCRYRKIFAEAIKKIEK